MEQPPLPEDLRRFVLTSIPSVPYLEALLLLRAHAGRQWSSEAVANRLYIRDKVAQALLDDLCKAGIAEACADQDPNQHQTAYCYRPASHSLGAMIDRLADLYAKQLVEVTVLIHSKLDRKAHQFADAFKWRKDN